MKMTDLHKNSFFSFIYGLSVNNLLLGYWFALTTG